MSEVSNNKRHFHRIFYNSEVSCISDTGESLPCQLLDISLNGCLLEFPEPWSNDQEKIYDIEITLSDQIKIIMSVSLAHVISNKAGFKCEHIDIDSISRLRRLVELNLGDSDILDRDLLALSEV